VTTRCTLALQGQLTALDAGASDLCSEFDHWKTLGAAGEYDSYLFGKDSAYVAPRVAGVPNVLRHVHLVPLADPRALAAWNTQWQRRGRKVSDRALVYASDRTHGHLLIYILAEPDAHLVARMGTPVHHQLMLKLAHVAECFMHDGSVIA
jgi:mRNA interferase YafO